jgi:1-acyl-sn-glycerol-3-phosphate acyltransferase
MPTFIKTKFTYTTEGMERIGKEPCLILMHHCSFTDMKLAYGIFYPRPLGIITSVDAMSGFLGKLMRLLGCTPTHKYITDLSLIKDMEYMLKVNKTSVLMYPEAGYSFDGTTTVLPSSLGKCVKLLGVPVVMIRTYGAYARDPLYNNLQRRRVRVGADMTYLLSAEEVASLSAKEIDAKIREQFAFDNFRWQQENEVKIDEPFRADCLNRVLYKCPACHAEGEMKGEGVSLTCSACGKSYVLDEYGYLRATEGETEFPHVPDWYAWERECVREELLAGRYRMEADVEIRMLVDTKCLYRVGDGHLVHDENGFTLTGCDGRLDYHQDPTHTYSLNSDFNWYEIGDVISIGNHRALYYCFPKEQGDFAAKARLATEELYTIIRERQRAERAAHHTEAE